MPLHLKSLELNGYKTFASRTVFEFSDSVTAIVGPNGSGKSNIADALRWVLGEQSYRLLRGQRTDDMIFSGSERRPRAGMASATIVFDNSEGWLPIDFSEVSITRRAYRDGQNEYLINNQKVRLRDVSELLSKSGLSERTYTVIGQGLVDAALSLRADERRRLFEEAAGIGLYRSRKDQALRRLDATKRNLERVQDILIELAPRLRSLRRQARRMQEYDQIRTDLREVLREWYGYHWHHAQQEFTRVRDAAAVQEKKLEAARGAQDELSQEMEAVRERIMELRTELDGWHHQLAELHTQREGSSRELAVKRERQRALLDRQRRSQQEHTQLQQEIELQLSRLAEQKKHSERLREGARGAQEQVEQARAALKVHRVKMGALEERQTRLLEARGEKRAELLSLQTQVKVLERAEQSLSGYAEGVRLLMQAAREQRLTGARGALSDHLQVSSELETAIAAALGDYLDAVLLDGGDGVEQALEVLKDEQIRAALLPLAELRPARPLEGARGEGCLGVAADLVQADESLRPVVDLLLGRVLVVEDRGAAHRILEGLDPDVRAVTLEGEVFHASGAVVLDRGSGTGVLGRPQQLRQLKTQAEDAEKALDELDQEMQGLKLEIDGLKGTPISSGYAINIAFTELSANKDEKTAEKDEQDGDSALEFTAAELEQQIAQWEAQAVVAQASVADSQRRLDERQSAIDQLRRRQDDLKQQDGELTAQLTELQTELETLREGEGQIAEQIAALQTQIEPAEQELRAIEERQLDLQGSDSGARQSLYLAERQSAQAQIALARQQEAIEVLRQRIEDDFGLVAFDYDESVSGPTPLPLGELVERLPVVKELPLDIENTIKRQKVQLRRMGSIYPEAQTEYEEVSERFEFLSSQVKDLEKAEKDLREVIAELDVLMEREFRKTFEVVAREFRTIFTRLFGGGAARLMLTDEEDFSNTGIDIEARLPGKRSQQLAMLSGGERSLTAAALVFALIKASPTPFCVLDEVDAMLDEANVVRFCEMLTELSETTQFVIITHNRGTVQVADMIYGITMGRDTASRSISLRLDEVDERYSE